mgnify:CR=1 FL=1
MLIESSHISEIDSFSSFVSLSVPPVILTALASVFIFSCVVFRFKGAPVRLPIFPLSLHIT